MNIVLWIMQGMLAAIFVMPGWGKISSSRQQHIADGHIKPGASLILIRILGILEWLGCIGVVVPWLTGIAPALTPAAALCFCIIMAAGMVTHTLRREYRMLPMLAVIFTIAALVAYFRYRQL